MGLEAVDLVEKHKELEKNLIKILKETGTDDEIEKIIVSEPESLRGEHMATITVYADVHYKNKSIPPRHLFVKKFSDNATHTQIFRDMKVMEKENGFFNDFLPYAKDFCKKYQGCENILDFFPKIIFANDDLVVQDNLVLGDSWLMLPKENLQDLHTAKIVLTNLAKFHAITFGIIKETGAEEFKKKWPLLVLEGFGNSELLSQMIEGAIGNCTNILNRYPLEGHEQATEYFNKLSKTAIDEINNLLMNANDNSLVVLNHGDCWNNNMLFKIDPLTGKVNDHIFIDLQEFIDDFKKNSTVGFVFNLSIITAFGAFKDIDLESMETDPTKAVEYWVKLINDWMDNNPESIKKLSTHIIALVQEHQNLINNL